MRLQGRVISNPRYCPVNLYIQEPAMRFDWHRADELHTKDSAKQGTNTDLLNVLQLILHSATVTTRGSVTPGHDRSIVKNSSKCEIGSLDVLHILKLVLHRATVTAHGRHCPRSRPIHHQEWLQRRAQWIGSAAHFSAHPALHCYHHRSPGHPR